ncbi:hypothetical protein [Umezawaea sp. Da 62-37]|uniref:hypothetical protein n=1 Tax=Umezawaea sp. Da 62-37 TaxID=3075927 RepID=UPI0028F6E45E|nr:hypothetical protein [Umezawaea sp. Da 62-37]WNV90297.1 hypothetical protein RM788_19055 [Umezawaea sp. Da 62-37]
MATGARTKSMTSLLYVSIDLGSQGPILYRDYSMHVMKLSMLWAFAVRAQFLGDPEVFDVSSHYRSTESLAIRKTTYASPWVTVLTSLPVAVGSVSVAAKPLLSGFRQLLEAVRDWQQHRQQMRHADTIHVRQNEIQETLLRYLKSILDQNHGTMDSEMRDAIVAQLLGEEGLERDVWRIIENLGTILEVADVDENDPRAR